MSIFQSLSGLRPSCLFFLFNLLLPIADLCPNRSFTMAGLTNWDWLSQLTFLLCCQWTPLDTYFQENLILLLLWKRKYNFKIPSCSEHNLSDAALFRNGHLHCIWSWPNSTRDTAYSSDCRNFNHDIQNGTHSAYHENSKQSQNKLYGKLPGV